MSEVLFVGFRLGALEAAERLGLCCRILHERELPPAVQARAQARSTALEREQVEAAVDELCAGASIAAVLGIVERTVLPASWARARLGLAPAGIEVADRCTDKVAMKRAAAAHEIPCTAWRAVFAETDPGELGAALGFPVVLKRKRSSGSRGMVVAHDADAITRALQSCDLAERFVHGREMSVESFVVDGRVVFVNPTEYLVPLHANVLPAELGTPERERILALNERVIAAMGVVTGITHVELFLSEQGPLFGEIAIRPPGGRIMSCLRRAWGFDPWEAWLRLELGGQVEFPPRARRAAGVWVLHPGAGIVESMGDPERVKELPGVRRVVCRVAPGDRVLRREGTGQDVGFIQVQGADRDQVAEYLQRAHAELAIRMRDA